LDRFPDLLLVGEELVPYKNNDNVDIMYLLEKNHEDINDKPAD